MAGILDLINTGAAVVSALTSVVGAYVTLRVTMRPLDDDRRSDATGQDQDTGWESHQVIKVALG